MSSLDKLKRLTKKDLWDATLITHEDCMDGTGSVLIWRAALKEATWGFPENFIVCRAGHLGDEFEFWLDPKNDEGQLIVITDLNLSEDKDKDIVAQIEKRGNVILLDHHKTCNWLADRDWCHVDITKCGTQILLDYIKHLIEPNELNAWQEFGNLVADRDLWKNELLPTSENLVDLMNFVGQKKFIEQFDDVPYRYTEDRLDRFFFEDEKEIVNSLYNNKALEIEHIRENVIFDVCDYGKMAVVLSSCKDVSTLLNSILEKYSDVKVAMNVNLEKRLVSLRSKGDTDVSKIAQKHGGGGHKNAAGYVISKDVLTKIVEEVL